jgi:hypothetical protein
MIAAEHFRFHVTATFPEGSYKTDVKAANPIKAITKVIKKLGLDQMPADPFLITVTPKRK